MINLNGKEYEECEDGETVETMSVYFWGLQNHCR